MPTRAPPPHESALPRRVRRAVLRAYGVDAPERCAVCDALERCHMAHLVPHVALRALRDRAVARHYQRGAWNYVPACARCNLAMGTRNGWDALVRMCGAERLHRLADYSRAIYDAMYGVAYARCDQYLRAVFGTEVLCAARISDARVYAQVARLDADAPSG